MSRLVEELKKEHAVIACMIGAVKLLDVSTREGREKVLAMKGALISHMAKEDTQIYPALKVASARDERLLYALEPFVKELEWETAFVTQFFKKYANGKDGGNFSADVARLISTVKSRMSREESLLYPEYDKLCL